MKAISKINNNVALCVDNNGNELVAFGKGIGFPEMPYEIKDLSLINRTFYKVKKEHLPLFVKTDDQILEICYEIIDYARLKTNKDISDSLFYILVDHLSFAIERAKKNIYIPLKLANDIKYLYAEEMDVGYWALDKVNKKFNVNIPRSEAALLAMHIVECEENSQETNIISDEKIVQDIGKIVEENMNIKIDLNGFNYARFVSHLQYLIQRSKNNEKISSENLKLYDNVSNEFPLIKTCVINIKEYLSKYLKKDINEEEQLYLMLHINRLCAREDCNQ